MPGWGWCLSGVYSCVAYNKIYVLWAFLPLYSCSYQNSWHSFDIPCKLVLCWRITVYVWSLLFYHALCYMMVMVNSSHSTYNKFIKEVFVKSNINWNTTFIQIFGHFLSCHFFFERWLSSLFPNPWNLLNIF